VTGRRLHKLHLWERAPPNTRTRIAQQLTASHQNQEDNPNSHQNCYSNFKLGRAVAQLVKAMRYKVRVQMVSLEFFIDIILPALGLTQPLTEMSTKNISWRGKGFRCIWLTTLPPSCADCLEIWEPPTAKPSGSVQACNGIALPFTFSS
jgi:hypothetical protein